MKNVAACDYFERVYAGVLGKVIGVYMGHPCEGWTHDRIMRESGEHWYYMHDRLHETLITTDDDIAGTFLFIRALEDFPLDERELGRRIAQVWLNGLVEHESVLAWSGRGMSTEHTAYLNLKRGLLPPESGSIERNGKAVAEQIGGQIFIDGWGLISPGDPEQAADLAGIAASVSHDGEGIYGSQVVAAIEAMAFTETDFETMILRALDFVPADCDISRMNRSLVSLRKKEDDWRKAYRFMLDHFSYDHYPGNIARRINGLEPLKAKNGSRFHFSLPGSVQGFLPAESGSPSMLAVKFGTLTQGEPLRIGKEVFTPFDKRDLRWYKLTASPLVYPGQTLKARVGLSGNAGGAIRVGLYAEATGKQRDSEFLPGDSAILERGGFSVISMDVPDTGGRPIARIGIEARAVEPDLSLSGSLFVDYLDIQGIPRCSLIPPTRDARDELWWTYAWNGNPDVFYRSWPVLRFSKHGELGVLSCGTRGWDDYRVDAEIVPHLFKRGGIGVRCRGLRRYVGVFITGRGAVQLFSRVDDDEVVLAEAAVSFEFDEPMNLGLIVAGTSVSAEMNNQQILKADIPHELLISGGAAVFCEDGTISVRTFQISPLD